MARQRSTSVGCLHKSTKIEKKYRQTGSTEVKNGGGCLAGIEHNSGGRLHSTWALTLTRPKTGGVVLTLEWRLVRLNSTGVNAG